jgi:uncharacterized protein
MKNNLDGKGNAALITGSSSGIGRAIAGELAKRGCETVVLVSRNRSELEKTAMSLTTGYGAKTIIIIQDLSEPDAAEKVYAKVSELGLTIDILVNNAGFAIGGPILENDIVEMDRMMSVHVDALTGLTRRFGSDMLARKSGKILNVSSVAGFVPVPYTGLYAATKAYINSFSNALAEELEGTGVTCTVLCPGGTESEMMMRARLNDTLLFNGLSFLVMSAEQVAKAGVDGMMKGKRTVVPGLPNKGLVALSRILSKKAGGKIGILLLKNH